MKGFSIFKNLFPVLCLCPLAAFPAMASGFPADGCYFVDVTLTGGTGKSSIRSPAGISIQDGEVTATIVWSSSHYDRMTVDGVDYFPVSTDDGSAFVIPVRLDEEMNITAETLAMSQPHEIEYTLYFDGSGLAPADTREDSGFLPVIAAAALIGSMAVLRLISPALCKQRKRPS